jgi:hypothetical protein
MCVRVVLTLTKRTKPILPTPDGVFDPETLVAALAFLFFDYLKLAE